MKMDLIKHGINPKIRNLKEGELELLREFETFDKLAKTHWSISKKEISIPKSFYETIDQIINIESSKPISKKIVILDGTQIKIDYKNKTYTITSQGQKLFKEIEDLVLHHFSESKVIAFLEEIKQIILV